MGRLDDMIYQGRDLEDKGLIKDYSAWHLECISVSLAMIVDLLTEKRDAQKESEENAEKERIAEENRIALMSLYDVNLLAKTRNALLRHGFKTVGQIASLSAKQILGIPHIGQQGLNDIQRMLTEYYRG